MKWKLHGLPKFVFAVGEGGSSIPEAVDDEVTRRTAEIAATAAAQVDQANRDAEAIARAAAASDHAARLSSIEGSVTQWQNQTNQTIAEMRADYEAKLTELRLSIPPISPPPIVVETPPSEAPVDPEKTPETPPASSSPPPPIKRQRAVL